MISIGPTIYTNRLYTKLIVPVLQNLNKGHLKNNILRLPKAIVRVFMDRKSKLFIPLCSVPGNTENTDFYFATVMSNQLTNIGNPIFLQ